MAFEVEEKQRNPQVRGLKVPYIIVFINTTTSNETKKSSSKRIERSFSQRYINTQSPWKQRNPQVRGLKALGLPYFLIKRTQGKQRNPQVRGLKVCKYRVYTAYTVYTETKKSSSKRIESVIMHFPTGSNYTRNKEILK